MKKNNNAISGVMDKNFKTIGLLTEGLSGEYQAGVWPGIMSSVREHKLNMLCFCGGSLSVASLDPWDTQGNVLYTFAEKYQLDGVIIAGSLGSYISDDILKEFLGRYSHLPAVTLAPTPHSIPAIFVDNRSGTRSLVMHLVEEHKYRKIAFVRGPEGNVEAEERFRLFQEVMHEHDISIREDCIISGDFTRECGANAVNQLIENKADFEVIIAADDETALGALQALRSHGKNVPDDVALVGFDDVEESKYITPPLTTVNQPLFDLGKTAVDMLYRLLEGEDIPQNTILEAKLIKRQSCGCFNQRADNERIVLSTEKDTLNTSDKLNVKDVLEYIEPFMDHPYSDFTEKIIQSFCHDVNGKKNERFLKIVDRIGQELVLEKRELTVWQKIFFELFYYSMEHLDKGTFNFAADILQRAHIIRGELGIRDQGVHRIHTVRENYFLHEIGDILKNTLDVNKLMDAIYAQLPQLGIKSFYISLYESKKAPSKKSRLRLACWNGKRISIDKAGVVFNTNDILPEGIVKLDNMHMFVAEPLYFQKEQFGIMLFEAFMEEPERYEILREYISGALHSALLIKKVQQQAETLAKANTELEKLREKEHAYLQAIKSELELGRKIQLGFLPEVLPKPDGWEISVEFMPAREVSGDFYDTFMLGDDCMAVIIADVSGKDVSAALFMSLIRTLLRVFSERAHEDSDDPLDAIDVVNDYIIKHHRQGDGRCMFATIFFGLLNPETGSMTYINAGHNSPICIKNNEVTRELAPTGPAVGLSNELIFNKETVKIEKGELVFAYTDGVTEAQSPKGEFFSQKRLVNLLVEEYATTEDKVKQVKDAINEHNGEAAPFDDITILAVKRG